MSQRDLELKKEAAAQRKMFMMAGMGFFFA